MKRIVLLLMVTIASVAMMTLDADQRRVYCRYCGQTASSVSSLTSNKCPRHPAGSYKGRHEPFSGAEVTKKVYCRWCGQSSSSISSLTSNKCSRHPEGSYKGYHQPYAGNSDGRYTCRYCGQAASSISSLTSNKCSRHPSGNYKGYHEPL